jgi:predicted SnoaL-like aldol condensation-catalyzing enzyme
MPVPDPNSACPNFFTPIKDSKPQTTVKKVAVIQDVKASYKYENDSESSQNGEVMTAAESDRDS